MRAGSLRNRQHMDLITPLLLLPDIHACLMNATLPSMAKKTNAVINFSKGSSVLGNGVAYYVTLQIE